MIVMLSNDRGQKNGGIYEKKKKRWSRKPGKPTNVAHSSDTRPCGTGKRDEELVSERLSSLERNDALRRLTAQRTITK